MQYVSAKDVVEATGLPANLFTDRVERERKRVPHLLLIRNLRFSLEAILQWELANSVRGDAKELVAPPLRLSRSLNRSQWPACRAGMIT